MDDLDHRLLRELGSGQVLLWGGTDPRLSAGDLARRLRVDRSTVRARVRAWQRAGFLRGFVALPSPALFGMGVAAAGVRVDDIAAKGEALDALATVDGILSGMEHVGEWIGLAFADEGERATRDRERQLARLPRVAEVQPAMRHRVPPCDVSPSRLQWRILQAIRREPQAPLGRVAARVGVSPNTFRAHYERLLDANAIWSVPELDFARYRGAALARLVLTLAGGADRRRVLAALKSAIPTVMEHPSPEGTPALLSVHVQAASVGELEEWTLAARALPGVVDAEALHPRRFRVYGAWLDQRVQAAIDIAGG